jgi:hypothetical protein
MKKLTLKRFWNQGAVAGVLQDGKKIYGLTLENPWLDNLPNISCIPAGEYICELDVSPKYGTVFHVRNVEGRSHILIHWGNYVKDTQGCILLGDRLLKDPDLNVPGVGNSRETVKAFMQAVGVKMFKLFVVWV